MWLSIALALLQVAPAPQALDAESAAWEAAAALKKKSAFREAAQAFEALEKASPKSGRAPAALVEAGVCWFSVGRDALALHRNTPQSREGFGKALALFDRVVAERPTDVVASRAAYMSGSTHLFAGELELAEAAYGSVVDTYKTDPSYVGKALERRAATRRHLLRPAPAIADYKAWQQKFTSPPETVELVKKELENAAMLGKPPRPVTAEAWVVGQPIDVSQPSGDVIALYFYATWCENCAKELPFLRELDKRYSPQGLRIVGVIDHSKGQTLDVVKKYTTEQAIPFATLFNDGSAASLYGVGKLPHLVLIDREGVVRWRDNPANLSDWTLERLLHGDEKPTPQK